MDRAKQIARETLDGKYWLTDVGKATHYHARWVHPHWVREMQRLDQHRRAHLLSPAQLGRRRRLSRSGAIPQSPKRPRRSCRPRNGACDPQILRIC